MIIVLNIQHLLSRFCLSSVDDFSLCLHLLDFGGYEGLLLGYFWAVGDVLYSCILSWSVKHMPVYEATKNNNNNNTITKTLFIVTSFLRPWISYGSFLVCNIVFITTSMQWISNFSIKKQIVYFEYIGPKLEAQ